MSEKSVRVLDLPGCRVVSVYAFGEEPESKSHEVMHAFFGAVGWDEEEMSRHRIFGFNNPDPSPGSERYGYEHWITIDDSFVLPPDVPAGISIKEMEGGLYASLESRGIPNPVKWGGVVKWINGSEYQYDGSRQWLEEIVLNEIAMLNVLGNQADPDELVFNLMSPIIQAAEKMA